MPSASNQSIPPACTNVTLLSRLIGARRGRHRGGERQTLEQTPQLTAHRASLRREFARRPGERGFQARLEDRFEHIVDRRTSNALIMLVVGRAATINGGSSLAISRMTLNRRVRHLNVRKMRSGRSARIILTASVLGRPADDLGARSTARTCSRLAPGVGRRRSGTRTCDAQRSYTSVCTEYRSSPVPDGRRGAISTR